MEIPNRVNERTAKRIPLTQGFGRHYLDYSGDYIDLPNLDTIMNTATIDSITVLAWIRTTHTGYMSAVSSWTPNTTFTLEEDSNEHAQAVIRIEATAYPISGTRLINDGLWHLHGFTYDGAELIGYLDGKVFNSDSSMSGALDNPSSNVHIGDRPDGGYPWDGQIGPVFFFNRVLSQSEIRELMLNYHIPSKSGLVLWLPLGTGFGATAHDESGEGNDGSITGATWEDLEKWELRSEAGI